MESALSAHHLALLLLTLAAAAAAAEAVAAPLEQQRNCSDPRLYPPNPFTKLSNPCHDFCSGRCAFSPSSTPVNLTLVRMTPRHIRGLANKDTGDDAGDLFFSLLSAEKPSECIKPNPPPWAGCFLDGDNVYVRSRVEVDGNWGIYQECNPASAPLPPKQANSGSFACCGQLNCTARGGLLPAHNNSNYCYCPRTNKTVGRTTVAAHFSSVGFIPPVLHKIASLTGGMWYSTPAEGECKGNARPGDTVSGCTWRVAETLAVVNQTCVKGKVFGVVQDSCPHAFAGECSDPKQPCYANAFFSAVLGNKTLGCPGLTRKALLKPWNAAFDECPPVQLE
eukprot:UC1_evm3s1355